MATLRNYSKSGTLNWSVTSPVSQGGLGYIGGGRWAVANSDGIYVLTIYGKTATLDKQIHAFTGASGNGAGVSVKHNGGGALLAAIRQDIGAPAARLYRLASYDLQTGTQNWVSTISGSGLEGGLAFNGNQWWASNVTEAVSNAERIYLLDVSGASATIARSTAMANASPPSATYCSDMCFDGLHLFTIQGTNLLAYEMEGRKAPFLQFTWAIAGVNPLGIDTDGNSLTILSRS